MGSIGATLIPKVAVGVATENGRAYYIITSLLNKMRIPYVDVLFREYVPRTRLFNGILLPFSSTIEPLSAKGLKLIITTRRERLRLNEEESAVICVEDLGEDIGIAKEKLLAMIHPSKETDWFVVGIDPGERTGIAAFMNQMEVESSVLSSIDDTILRVGKLLDNAPRVRKIVKIGAGIPFLAEQIATKLGSLYGSQQLRIQLVDERGTSSLRAPNVRPRPKGLETRDQRAAKLIAFREGTDYFRLCES